MTQTINITVKIVIDDRTKQFPVMEMIHLIEDTDPRFHVTEITTIVDETHEGRVAR